jgi:cyanophycinase
VLIDTRTATRRPGWPFAQKGITVSLLRDGDRLDLTTLAITPAPGRAGQVITPSSPGFEPDPELPSTLATGDILAPWQFGRLMAQVLESRQGIATGLAFDAAAPATRPAFRMLLTRQPDSVGWAGGGVTVSRLKLDVEPVRMADILNGPAGR